MAKRPKRKHDESSTPSSSSASPSKKRSDNPIEDKKKTPTSTLPLREFKNLFSSTATVKCALEQKCVPCAYKICNFDVALDKEFTRMVPNKRPESCVRSSSSSPDEVLEVGIYTPGMHVLTVGDGDFTFSLAVARRIMRIKDETGKVNDTSRMVATSYESHAALCDIYPDITSTISDLEELGVEILYDVDATNLKKSLSSKPLDSFHRIIWNFPCTAVENGQDGQNDAMEENKNLIRKFFISSKTFLDSKIGEIHITHKTKPPYNQWNISEDIPVESGMGFKGSIVFDKCCFTPYTPRKAQDKKSFPCHDACIFVFGVNQTSEKDMVEGVITSSIPSKDDDTRHDMMPVSREMLINIRSTHWNHCVHQKALKFSKKKKWKRIVKTNWS